MTTDVIKYFDELKYLKINYSNPDFQSLYRNVVTQEVFGKALNYDSSIRCDKDELSKQEINETIEGAFHIVLNVKVDASSPFIPFAYVTNTNPNYEKKAKEILKGISISYNFSNLLDDLSLIKKEAVESVSFSTTVDNNNEEGLKVLINELEIDDKKASSNYSSLLNEILLKENNFIRLLSEAYHNNDITSKLYYNILSFDYDINSGHKLTQFLLISESKEECYYFTQIRVRALRDIVSIIRTRYISDISKKNSYESIKSAVSAIMSRNMSHNLGSHYLYYTKNHLERLANEISNEQSPDIRGAARVLGYTQARMDYLATIISNDKYPYGSVNFKSQIFDELTIDDFSKRHFIGEKKKNSRTVNYLLSNLIRSEDFTRPDIMTDGGQNPNNLDLLKLQIKYSSDGKEYECFTGTNFIIDEEDDPNDFKGIPTLESESPIKYILSNIEVALPGGNMSCHAFFNVVENFIRNSAKYLREDFHKEEGHKEKSLTTNIVLRYKDTEHKFIEIILFDDKENATYYKLLKRTYLLDTRIQESLCGINSFFNGQPDVAYIRSIGPTIIKQLKDASFSGKDVLLREAKSIVRSWQKDCLYEQILKRLGSIRVLDENNALDKENKGLKEMMFSSAWMRSYNFPPDKTYTDIIFDIQNEENAQKKLELIKGYCFAPVLVLENGKSLSILSEDDLDKVYYLPVCFGLSFELPVFRKTTKLNVYQDESTMIQECLRTYSDIILADLKASSPLVLNEVFTRVYPLADSYGKSPTKIFKEILRARFAGFDDYWISFGNKMETCGIHDDAHHIKFDHHMKDHVLDIGGLESQLIYAYSDSVSGGNFTKTMNELFDAALVKDGYRTEADEFFILKIKESALTRVTIIDERLSDTMEKSDSQLELSLKNIRLLNYRDKEVITSFTDLFEGNSFKDNKDNTNFLSIHLGLVEKIIQSTEFRIMLVTYLHTIKLNVLCCS